MYDIVQASPNKSLHIEIIANKLNKNYIYTITHTYYKQSLFEISK